MAPIEQKENGAKQDTLIIVQGHPKEFSQRAKTITVFRRRGKAPKRPNN